jgi:alanine dehydrogenase
MFGSALMPAVNTMVTMGMAYTGVAYGPGSFGPNSSSALTAVNFEFVFYVDLNDGNGIRQQAVIVPATSFSANTVGLMPSFSHLNTTGVARNATLDYILVAQERFNA